MRTSVYVACLFALLVSGSNYAAPASNNGDEEFISDCECPNCHGEDRWDAKTVTDEPPSSGIQAITPSVIGGWKGPGGKFNDKTDRIDAEKVWYKVTGRVTIVKINPDGDIHIQMVDESAPDNGVNVIVEVPDGEPWCALRHKVFGWVQESTPLVARGQALTLKSNPVITVTGMAFYDAHHKHGTTKSNRRTVPNNPKPTTEHVAVWEIHPVMEITP